MEGTPEHSGAWFFHDDYVLYILIGESVVDHLICLDLHVLSHQAHTLGLQGHIRFVYVAHSFFHLVY